MNTTDLGSARASRAVLDASSKTPFYNTDELRAAFRDELLSWEGTPFVPHGAIKRGGADCVSLGLRSYQATGFLSAEKLPEYSLDGGKHLQISQLEGWLEAHGFGRVCGRYSPAVKLQSGDTLCFRCGRVAHHAGFMADEKFFLHALFKNRVMIGSFSDPVLRFILMSVYRPMRQNTPNTSHLTPDTDL